ncbi:hypothetical protein V8B55DRAFT_1564424 [Mucor lusitanicus]
MKLRNRTTRVIGDGKQEDCKPAPNATGESSSILASSSNSCGLIIKQEDAKDDKALLELLVSELFAGDEFGTKEYLYQCNICNQRMPNRTSVLEHRFSIHNIKSRISRAIRDINKNTFLALKKLPSHTIPLKGIFPDPDDPKLYCKACNYTYTTKKNYKSHCRYMHGVASIRSANQKSNTSSNMIDTYCQACDKRFAKTSSYRQHLFFAHRRKNDIVPDADDPNFYCCSCSKKLGSKKSFREHLIRKHSIFPSVPRKQSPCKPDIDDPNNYCRACQKTYSVRNNYRRHLLLIHQMTLPTLKNPADCTNLPDLHNPDHYCSVCKKSYTLLHLYRRHCRQPIVNPNAKIDINDPNFFCAQCEHSFSSRSVFKRHLARFHSN